MNKILRETHKDSNILKLRARDYYFGKAVKQNRIKNVFILLPTCLLVVTYTAIIISHLTNNLRIQDVLDKMIDNFEIIIGILTIVCFIIVRFVENKIDKNKEISNIFRESYDNTIFGLRENLFSYDYNLVEKLLEKGKYSPADYNNWKYEYWYDETFSDDTYRNILCMQMDNALYSFNVFSLCKKEYQKHFVAISLLMVALTITSAIFVDWRTCFLVLFAMFELLRQKWEEVKTSEKIIKLNKRLIHIVQSPENVEKIVADIENQVYNIEECIIENRKKGLFLPKKIRNLYIDYYRDLDKIKSLYLNDESVKFPESSDELEIFSRDENTIYTLTQLQERLQIVLEDIIKVFEENSIPYYLDRGTLLGSVRKNISGVEVEKDIQYGNFNNSNYIDLENGGFLFWDDSINITIPVEYETLAKEIIKNTYISRYIVQDYIVENNFVSYRGGFFVREVNEKSILEEKNPISILYKEKGIYITINTLSPIVLAPFCDKFVRRVLFNRLVERLDNNRMKLYWSYVYENKKKYAAQQKKYDKLQYKFNKRNQLYKTIAKSKKCFCYSQGNTHRYEMYPLKENVRKLILKWFHFHTSKCNNEKEINVQKRFYNIKKHVQHPYLNDVDIFNSQICAMFECNKYKIPANFENYLKTIYGESWIISPFSKKDDLKKHCGDSWYSVANRFHISSLKHTRHLDLK